MFAALAALVFVGFKILGPHPTSGIKAGMFVAVAGLLLILLITRFCSMWIESWVYDSGWISLQVGIAVTALIGLSLLFWAGTWLLKPSTAKTLVAFKDQGWFGRSDTDRCKEYLPSTIFGLLLLAIAGVWTMVNSGELKRGAELWELNVPFIGVVLVDLSEKKTDKEGAARTRHERKRAMPVMLSPSSRISPNGSKRRSTASKR